MGTKWNQDAGPSEKLLTMYTLLLFSNRHMSLGELAEELDCSKQSVLRLITRLEASRFGKIRRSRRGRESIYCLDRPADAPRISLNAEGLRQLVLCRDFLAQLLPQSVRNLVDATLQQASAYIPAESRPDALHSIGASYTKGHIDYSPFQSALDTFNKCIRKRLVCSVRYRASIQATPTAFDYAPGRLVVYREAIYIHGWVVTDRGKAVPRFKTSTSLALHRVLEVIPTRRSSAHLPDIKDTNAQFFGLLNEEPFTVRIRFDPSVATYVAEREWSGDQHIKIHQNGAVTLSMTARSQDEVMAWVLSFAGAAELLSPRWLRDRLAGQVRLLMGRYDIRQKVSNPRTEQAVSAVTQPLEKPVTNAEDLVPQCPDNATSNVD